ncbi:hypothetical protein I9W82_000477 [Candida metapsilosis]|uniref:Cyclin n=1 Tax=Candida metapsilosis TaxID=273372 RepID=A0A8H8DDG4_9ASCO|nr:hypothetical protein I9W82_000477 [Candida metapsilosis]
MSNYIKDIEEIPSLKPPQETFVDDPTSLQDIHLDELVFDLSNGLKNMNNLHIYHVIYIYSIFIKFTISLQQQYPTLYTKFRQQQLEQLQKEKVKEEEERKGDYSSLKKRKITPSPETSENKNTVNTTESSSIVSPSVSNSSTTNTIASCSSSASTLNTEKSEDNKSTSTESAAADAGAQVNVDDGKTVVESDFTNENDLSDILSLDRCDSDEILFSDENIDNINFNYNSNGKRGPDDDGSLSPGNYVPIESLLEQFNLSECSNNSSEEDIAAVSAISTFTTPTHKLRIPTTKSNYAKSILSEVDYAQQKTNTHSTQLVKVFQLIKTPSLPIDQFLLRIKQYSPSISIPAYLHSIYILFKLTTLLSTVSLTTNNSYRFVIGSLRTCTKLLDDVYQKQSNFTHVVGVGLRDLSKIEVNFVYLINFNFNLQCLEQTLARFLQVEFVQLCQFMKLELNEVYNEVINSF